MLIKKYIEEKKEDNWLATLSLQINKKQVTVIM